MPYYEDLQKLLEASKGDLEKFAAGNMKAAVRARKALKALVDKAKDVRKEISSNKKTIKAERKAAKAAPAASA